MPDTYPTLDDAQQNEYSPFMAALAESISDPPAEAFDILNRRPRESAAEFVQRQWPRGRWDELQALINGRDFRAVVEFRRAHMREWSWFLVWDYSVRRERMDAETRVRWDDSPDPDADAENAESARRAFRERVGGEIRDWRHDPC